MAVEDELTIDSRPASGKSPGRRRVRVVRYVGGWDISLSIGNPEARRADVATRLYPDQARVLAAALLEAAAGAVKVRDEWAS
jgi:hypothetical protein